MLSERLTQAMKSAGVSQAALARACKVAPPSVHGWLSGKSKFLRGENLLSAAKALGVSEEWLATGKGPMKDQSGTHDDTDFVSVRRADVKASNGHGQVIYYEDDRPPLSFRSDFLRKLGISPGNAVVVDAEGTSNYPKITEGSVVLLNRGDTERLDGGFFAFRYDGDLLIKRLERLEGAGIVATAENSDFKPKMKIYGPREMADFEVIGRAVWTGSML